MALDLSSLRIVSYAALAVFSFINWCLTIARLSYTSNLPRGDTLNGDPDIVELLITCMMSIAWALFLIRTIYQRVEGNLVSTFRGELVGLFVIWMFWTVGGAIASQSWGNLGWCAQFQACQILSAIVAFCWLSWLAVTFNLGVSLTFIVANNALLEPLHGQWVGPAVPNTSQTGNSRPVSAV
ncbi:unnamed protein product [Mycena citricolor]|uniref:MARVEL domain-containing protein n=1 Tax=Mycena citricolor TaxID=2018698 RepID=A0AAD2H8L0_9AGAR|nr:unnamed protein product [Mycena citricolor]